MAQFDLNLSTRPFPAYRIVNIALIAGLATLGAVSVWQAAGFMKYSEMANSIRAEEQQKRVDAEALGKEAAELEARLERPESEAKLREINFLNFLLLRKNLSWTKLFGILEETVPPNVHFTKLTPNIGEDGGVSLDLAIRAKTIDDITEFLERLEKSPYFERLLVTIEEKKEEKTAAATVEPRTDVDVTLSVSYFPSRDAQ